METETLTGILRETLAQFDPSGEPRTTTEVADDLGLGRRSTYNRLERLVEHDRLETKKVGANARVWWRPPATAPAVPDWSAAAESLVDDVLDDVEVGIFVLDENFDVAWINEATERYFGLAGAQVIGRNKRRLVDEHLRAVVDDSERFAETVLATYDDNTYDERFECRVTPGDDREERWLEHRSRPVEAGAYAGGRVELYYDVTDRKHTQLARQEDREQFELLVSAVEEYAIFTLDRDGHVLTWNPGVERLKGYEADEILDEHFSIFYTETERAAGVPERNLEAAAERGSVEDEGWRVRKDGSQFWANVTITAIRDDDGRLKGYAKVTRDTTERRERERQLRRERNLTERLLEIAPIQFAVFRADGSVERTNARSKRYLGIDEAAVSEFDTEEVDLYDVDGNAVPEEAHPVHRVIETGERVSDLLLRHDAPDGSSRWVSLTAAPLFDDGGTLERVVVTGKDVTDLKRKERRLERRRDELKRELADVFDRIGDGFFGLDTDLRFTYVNRRAEDLLGRAEEDLLGTLIWEAFEPGPIAREVFEEVLDAQEPRTFEEYYEPLDTWFENHVYPSETGLSVYFQDVTGRKEREQQLEEYEQIVETIDDGIYVVDEDLRIRLVNEAYASLTGYAREELLGAHVSTVVDDEVVEFTRERREQLRAGERGGTAEVELRTATGDRITVEARYARLVTEGGEFRGTVGAIRDITERKRRQRELEEYRRWTRTLIENFPSGAVAVVDENLRYITFGGTLEGDTDVTREDLEGRPIPEVLPEQIAEVVLPHYEAALEGEPAEFEETIDGRVYQFYFVPVRDDDGDVFAATAMSQDVTERKEREDLLRDAKSQLEAATEAGAVYTWEWRIPDDEFVAGTSFARTFGEDPEAVREGVSLDRLVSAIHEDDREPVRRAVDEAIASRGEYREEYRVWDADDELRWVVARGRVECDDEGNPVTFPGALVDITERKRAERELERQREQLSALNGLNEVVSDITAAVIEQSTREEIEETVCERLAATDSYLFAWTGEVDPTSRTVTLRTEAGVEGYLDEATISVDPDNPRSEGPTGRALKRGEPQVTHDVRTDSRHDPWRDHAEQYGFRSSAAIPIIHEDTTYGVLSVYAGRPYAFEGREREVVGQLGEVVGHAIAAAERKQALLSDELVELDFRIPDAFAAVDAPVETNGTITLDHRIPIGDGEFLAYGTATSDALDAVHGLADALPHWKSVTVISDDEPVRFELYEIDPPVLSIVTSHGGYIDEVSFQDGDCRMTVHLAPTVDVRKVTSAVEEVYPQTELLRRHQISRPRDESRPLQRRLAADLTDRQRSALEAAYHAGFFEWPRDSTGEQIAESLGIAPPTFHHHLRKAQRKAFDVLLSASIPSTAARSP